MHMGKVVWSGHGWRVGRRADIRCGSGMVISTMDGPTSGVGKVSGYLHTPRK